MATFKNVDVKFTQKLWIVSLKYISSSSTIILSSGIIISIQIFLYWINKMVILQVIDLCIRDIKYMKVTVFVFFLSSA